jgi:transcriptional regulator with XRE-family HTH domain
MKLGSVIAELRKQNNLSQQELADKLNVTRSIITKWETSIRIPSYENFIEIADLFQVSADVLIQGDRKCDPSLFTSSEAKIDDKLRKLVQTYMLLSEDGKDALIGKAKELKIMQESTNSYPFTQAN